MGQTVKRPEGALGFVAKDDAWTGARARVSVLARAKVGRSALFGVGPVIMKPVPPYAIVGGTAVRAVGMRFSPMETDEHVCVPTSPVSPR